MNLNFSFFLLFFGAFLSQHVTVADLRVSLWTDGRYELLVNNKTWLKSSPQLFLKANRQTYLASDGTLNLTGMNAFSNIDPLGRWQSFQFNYAAFDDANTQMEASVITYDNNDLVRFRQNFPQGLKRCGSNNYDSILSAFPTFFVQNYDEVDLGYLSYGGMMSGDMEKLFGKWNGLTSAINDGMSGGPLVLFSPSGDTMIISQMSDFMDTSMQHNKLAGGSINFGIKSGVDEVPKNFAVEFLVYYSDKGINKAMEEWGQLLLKYYKKDLSYRENDFTSDYLSYWTDNGAYYYWMTEPGENYQDTLLDVILNSTNSKIPYRTIQYDSWWYGAEKGFRQGAFLWDGTVKTDKLPNSLTYLYDKLKLPVTAHNKFWDITVKYAKLNGGQYNFILDPLSGKSLPDDPNFWNDLLFNASRWGLKTYEQDWLNHQTLDFTPLLTNLTLGQRWLMNMGYAAQENKMTIQYCMALSRHIMTSLLLDAVTQARVTNDYATNFDYGGEQWRLGVSSMFVSALGLVPFKDVYWTTSNQPGNPYGPKAIDPLVELNSAVSILTAGPVGPGDRIGEYMNRTLIMRSCNEEGLLLKPSKPITAIDAQIYAKALGSAYGPVGETWSTYSNVSGVIFGIVFAADIKNTFDLKPSNVAFYTAANSVVRKDGDVKIDTFSESSPIKLNSSCSAKNFCLFYVSPLFSISGHQIAILGETSKWVPVSPKRISSIVKDSVKLALIVQGGLNENVEMSFLIDSDTKTVRCQLGQSKATRVIVDFSSSTLIQCVPI